MDLRRRHQQRDALPTWPRHGEDLPEQAPTPPGMSSADGASSRSVSSCCTWSTDASLFEAASSTELSCDYRDRRAWLRELDSVDQHVVPGWGYVDANWRMRAEAWYAYSSTSPSSWTGEGESDNDCWPGSGDDRPVYSYPISPYLRLQGTHSRIDMFDMCFTVEGEAYRLECNRNYALSGNGRELIPFYHCFVAGDRPEGLTELSRTTEHNGDIRFLEFWLWPAVELGREEWRLTQVDWRDMEDTTTPCQRVSFICRSLVIFRIPGDTWLNFGPLAGEPSWLVVPEWTWYNSMTGAFHPRPALVEVFVCGLPSNPRHWAPAADPGVPPEVAV